MNSKLFEAALARAAKTWKTYVSAICVLYLTLLIDFLSGFSFLSGREPINLAGFKVVREALSLTYGILFALFVTSAWLESRVLRASSSGSDSSMPADSAALDLWFISPFSSARPLRFLFWFLFVDGFLFLAQFSLIHLACLWPPDPKRMSEGVYIMIGVIDLILLLICLPLAYRIYKNLQHVRAAHALIRSGK